MFRTAFGMVVAALVVAGIGSPATDVLAQAYPAKPIRIVVGNAPGGSSDVAARVIGQKASELLGQPVIVENRAGASGAIANDRVAKSPPDGYTLLVMSATGAMQSILRTDLPYNLERDLEPISLLTSTPLVLVVHPSLPVRDVKGLLALARKRPGELNYGSSGVGSIAHLAGEAFSLVANVKINHIPYKGGAESVIAAASGQVEMSLPGITGALPLIQGGKVKPIAVTTGERAPLLPSLPTLNEAGLKGFDYSIWSGLLAPAGMPKGVVERISATMTSAMNAVEVKEMLGKQALYVRPMSPRQFADFMQQDLQLNRKLLKSAGLL